MLAPTNLQLIDAPAGKLEIDALWQQQNPKARDIEQVALLCHPNPLQAGTMMNKVVTTMYRFARDQGFHVVRFNYRGVGHSTGSYGNMVGEIEDALTVLQWIHCQTEARKLWLGGFSFGGYVAMRLAQTLTEQGAFLGLDDFELTNLALIAPSIEKHATTGLALPSDKSWMINGAQDEVIAPRSLQQFGEDFAIATRIVANTGHFFHGKLGELTALLTEMTQPSH